MQGWYDEHLAWQPDDFADISTLIVHRTAVWTPNIESTDRIDQSKYTDREDDCVFIMADGLVTSATSELVTVKCPIKSRLFPFGTQTCSQVYRQTNYPHEMMQLDVRTFNNLARAYREHTGTVQSLD